MVNLGLVASIYREELFRYQDSCLVLGNLEVLVVICSGALATVELIIRSGIRLVARADRQIHVDRIQLVAVHLDVFRKK